MNKKVWAIIPARNEEKTLSPVISETKKYVDEVIVVDDGSTDNTYEIASKQNIATLSHIVNLGKGAALKTGCDYALSHGAKKIIVLDADAQHNPDEIPNFIKALDKNDIVFGYRQINRKMPLILKFGNWFINKVCMILFKTKIKDSQCGFRAFTNDAYKKIRWNATDYSMESEMIANAGKNRLRYDEVPIQTIYSDKYKGTTVLDGIKIVINMLIWKMFKVK